MASGRGEQNQVMGNNGRVNCSAGFLFAIVVILVFSSSHQVCEAETIPATRLSLSDAVSRALMSNPNLRQEEERYQSALSRVRIAGVGSSFDLGSSTLLDRSPYGSARSADVFGELILRSVSGTEASLRLSPFGSLGSVNLLVRHPLMKGRGLFSERANLLGEAKSEASVSSRQVRRVQQSAILDVVNAYYGAVLAGELVKVKQDAVNIAQKAADDARKRAEAGLIAEIQVSRAEIRVAQTRNELNVQQQLHRDALDRLMVAIGEGVGQSLELADGIPSAAPELPSLSTATESALESRDELGIYDDRIAEQERLAAVSRDNLRPGLNLVMSLGSAAADDGLIARSLWHLGTLTAGVEYRAPLDRRVAIEETNIAARQVGVLQSLRAFQEEEIAEQVRNAYRSAESSRESLAIFDANVKVAEENLRLAERMVEEGVSENRDVLEAQEALARSRIGLLAAKTDLYLAGVRLDHAMGRDLTR